MTNIITWAKEKYRAEHIHYSAANEKLETQIDRAKARLARLEKARSELQHPSWIDILIKPIAEAMSKRLPDRTVDILGPCGITCATAIHFYKKGVDNKDKFNGDNCISITFRPAADLPDLTVIDYSVDTQEFKPGTLGEINGMNHPSIPIQDDIDWLLSFMLKTNAEKRGREPKEQRGTSRIHPPRD